MHVRGRSYFIELYWFTVILWTINGHLIWRFFVRESAAKALKYGRWVTPFYLPLTRLSTNGMNHTRHHRWKKFFTFFIWSRFYVFNFPNVFYFIFKKNVGKVQSNKQANKKQFQNNSNEIDLWFVCCISNDLKCLPINFYLLTMFDALCDVRP